MSKICPADNVSVKAFQKGVELSPQLDDDSTVSVELLGIEREDGIRFSEIRDIPCWIIYRETADERYPIGILKGEYKMEDNKKNIRLTSYLLKYLLLMMMLNLRLTNL